MQRPMRRKRQELSLEEAYSIVDQATSGVLALVDDGLPYAVPLSHAPCRRDDLLSLRHRGP